MRPWAERVYGIPPEQVIGSSILTKFEMREGKPVLVRLPQIDFVDDKGGKPVGIQMRIGRLDKGLDEAKTKGWTVVDMKQDWKVIYPTGSAAARAPAAN
jgi:hypothetical protein